MKRIFSTLLLLPVFAFAQKGFTINGNITGLTDGEVKITSTQGEQLIASAQSKNGAFVLKGTIAEPALYWLKLGKEQPQYVFLENTAMKITGTPAQPKVEGSASHKDFEEFQKIFNPIISTLNNSAAQLQQATEKNREGLLKNYDDALKQLDIEVGKFVARKKTSFVSPFLLFITTQVSTNPMVLEQRFNSLDASIRTSAVGKNLSEYIAYAKVGAIGTDALDFTQNDPDGKPVKLSSFKGKYVLVDFWASWCRPCRIENPNVVKAFNKFKAKNFTILGVSLDSQKDAWLKAIEADNLKWTHVSDLQQWSNAVAQMYRVQSIPQNFLIGPDGKIVAKDLRGEDLEKKLCELLGCK